MAQWFDAQKVKPVPQSEVLGACLDDGLLFHNIVVYDDRDGGQWTLVSNETVEMDVRFWTELPALPRMPANTGL